jgi:hypothetical protein
VQNLTSYVGKSRLQDIHWQDLLCEKDKEEFRLDVHESDLFAYQGRSNRNTQTRDKSVIRHEFPCDIDSLLGRITSLAALKGGMTLSYTPSYFSTQKEDSKATFDGIKMQDYKHFRLGHGGASGGYGYNVYIIFRHLPKLKEPQLTDEQLKAWIDYILHPAIEEATRPDIYQHHPENSESILARARVMKEAYMKSRQQRMDYRVNLPEDSLDKVWKAILARADGYREGFQEPLLVVVAHGIKCFTKSAHEAYTPQKAAQKYLEHLQTCFHYEFFDKDDTWVDFASEHLAVYESPKDAGKLVTLLHKKECMEAWAKRFDVNINANVMGGTLKIDRYCVAGTYDAGNIAFVTKRSNLYGRKIVHAKAYSVVKEAFSTSLNNHVPFSNKDLLAAGLSESLITRFYKISSNSTAPSEFRAHLFKTWLATKHRIWSGMTPRTYSTRMEFRINIKVLEKLAVFP